MFDNSRKSLLSQVTRTLSVHKLELGRLRAISDFAMVRQERRDADKEMAAR